MSDIFSVFDNIGWPDGPDEEVEWPKHTVFPYELGNVEIGYVKTADGRLDDWWFVDEDIQIDLSDRALLDDILDELPGALDYEKLALEFGILTLVDFTIELEEEHGEYGGVNFWFPIVTWKDSIQREVCVSCFSSEQDNSEINPDGYCVDCLRAINETNQYHMDDILGVN